MEDRKKLTVVLLIIGVVLLLVAGCLGYYIWWQGKLAETAANNLLEEQSQSQEEPTTFSVLQIPSIDLELPIIWDYSEDALKTSICRYQGPDPGNDGNLVITGHDYLNGAHFGKLDDVKSGDDIVVYDKDGAEFHYTVYLTEVIKPDEVEKLEKFSGDQILTLMTCTDNANKRLLVRCRPA